MAALLLLETGKVNADSKDKNDRTPLSWVAENGNEAIVKLLLTRGADVEWKDREGETPLSLATKNGHKAVARLLDMGIDSDDGERRKAPENAGREGQHPLPRPTRVAIDDDDDGGDKDNGRLKYRGAVDQYPVIVDIEKPQVEHTAK